jgi:hypothetical protein
VARRGGRFASGMRHDRRTVRRGLGAALLAVPAVIAVAAAAERVTPAAVWRAPAGFMSRFHTACAGLGGGAFDACFVTSMRKAGASPAALAFVRRLDGEAYLEALVETDGSVALAHVVFPFRANENEAWFIVNGTPPLIDVDDERYLALAAMQAAPAYIAIARQFPEVTFWPGDRGREGPQVRVRGRRIVVDYRLRNLCHACAVVGHARFAFDFDAAGKFLGTRLVSVAAAGG